MISSSAASYSVKSTSDNRAGGCGLGPGGGAGHERGSTHSVQSLFNLENNVTQWDILTFLKIFLLCLEFQRG